MGSPGSASSRRARRLASTKAQCCLPEDVVQCHWGSVEHSQFMEPARNSKISSRGAGTSQGRGGSSSRGCDAKYLTACHCNRQCVAVAEKRVVDIIDADCGTVSAQNRQTAGKFLGNSNARASCRPALSPWCDPSPKLEPSSLSRMSTPSLPRGRGRGGGGGGEGEREREERERKRNRKKEKAGAKNRMGNRRSGQQKKQETNAMSTRLS